mmetsp:Transcript_74598/g.147783  ORF Transcript_74598/g.147783 Transcript_74598/m.147783 type:complete len:493 (+) Transcript_74598:189-1667(+)
MVNKAQSQGSLRLVSNTQDEQRIQPQKQVDPEVGASAQRANDQRGAAKCTLSIGVVCLLLSIQSILYVGAASYYLSLSRRSEASKCLACFHEADAIMRAENQRLRQENARLKLTIQQKIGEGRQHPYKMITGSYGHDLPEMYGNIKEKTIWAFWHDPEKCPSSKNCELPPLIQLCVETQRYNRGSFDHRLVHYDEVSKFVSWMELPFHFKELAPPQQKDALMNALLARYGGVAMDISTVLLRPIDDYWDEMVEKGATFRGYMYRLNGQPWRHAEVTVVWFLMSRREGIFSTAVRNQVIGMGDRADTKMYHHWYLALGDQTLLPILSMFNYTLPKCFLDPTIRTEHGDFPDQNPNWCPEREQPFWFNGLTGPPRTDTKILLRDPRDGPQLPFLFSGIIASHVDDNTDRWKGQLFQPGSPMHGMNCSTAKTCWDNVFWRRFTAPAAPGEAKLLSFIKLFHHGSEFDGKTREGILADKMTFFYRWLKLSGLPHVD